tara:strand:+ start:9931 stop:10173 length:243 start_codon:yes stop_codon:yes gene_type:complete
MSESQFEGTVIGESVSAVLFQGVYWAGGVWLPKSQIRLEEDLPDSFFQILYVKDWLANKNGILEFTEYSESEIEGFNSFG